MRLTMDGFGLIRGVSSAAVAVFADDAGIDVSIGDRGPRLSG
jgi:hypothetical protein